MLAALAVVLTRSADALPLVATALVFAGLIASYALVLTTGVPVLHPEPEAVDGLALFTKAVEAVGLVLAAGACSGGLALTSPHPTERNTDMNTTRASRPIPIALTALVAFFSALAALAVSNGMTWPRRTATRRTRHADAGLQSVARAKAVALRTRHAQALGRPHHLDAPRDHQPRERHSGHRRDGRAPAANQTDIGNAIKPFYGKAAGDELTAAAARAHPDRRRPDRRGQGRRQRKLADAQARWPRTPTRSRRPAQRQPALLEARRDEGGDAHAPALTTQEAVARLQGNWTADVAAYDQVHRHILHMSDLLSDGIVKQFPARFR